FFNLTMNQFDARQRYIEEVAGPPTEKLLFSVCKTAFAFASTTQVGFQAAVL
ncbi:hypothetical protein IFT48_09870, partial [Pseudomonas fluorescens]|nr:hypothetical protein [Pseudomonas fluorescens]